MVSFWGSCKKMVLTLREDGIQNWSSNLSWSLRPKNKLGGRIMWTLRARRWKMEIETTTVVIGALGSLRSSLLASSPGRSGKRKESLQLRLWNLNISIEKVDVSKWRHYPWNVFFNVCLHSHLFPLRADCRKFGSSVDGERQGNWKWNSKLIPET